MISKPHNTTDVNQKNIRIINEILSVYDNEYQHELHLLEQLISDVVALYAGAWPKYEACRTGYHNLQHSLEVSLVAARIMAGWNQCSVKKYFNENDFLLVVAAALFHDSGYILNRGDTTGSGGKFSFNHVERSITIFNEYASSQQLSKSELNLVSKVISITEYYDNVDLQLFSAEEQTRNMAAVIGTADLVAQMADLNYQENINKLFDEFTEAYELRPQDVTSKKVKVYTSAKQLLDETVKFYQEFVTPRLQKFRNVHCYLSTFFGTGRNPYMENISANLALTYKQGKNRQRIGDILNNLGFISQKEIEKALCRQKEISNTSKTKHHGVIDHYHDFLNSIDQHNLQGIGNILMDMGAIDGNALSEALLSQTIPIDQAKSLTNEEYAALLRFSVLLHHSSRDTWVFEQALKMAVKMINCSGSSVMMALAGGHELRVVISTAILNHKPHPLTVSSHKGLAGWVYRHQQAAMVDADAHDDSPVASLDSKHTEHLKSIMAIPLFINGDIMGAVEFYNKNEGFFGEQDCDLMTIAVNILAASFDL